MKKKLELAIENIRNRSSLPPMTDSHRKELARATAFHKKCQTHVERLVSSGEADYYEKTADNLAYVFGSPKMKEAWAMEAHALDDVRGAQVAYRQSIRVALEQRRAELKSVWLSTLRETVIPALAQLWSEGAARQWCGRVVQDELRRAVRAIGQDSDTRRELADVFPATGKPASEGAALCTRLSMALQLEAAWETAQSAEFAAQLAGAPALRWSAGLDDALDAFAVIERLLGGETARRVA